MHGNISEDIREFLETYRKEMPLILKEAYCFASYLILKDIEVNNSDILAGKWNWEGNNGMKSPYPKGTYQEIEKMQQCGLCSELDFSQIKDAVHMGLIVRSPGGHVVPGYDLFLKNGFDKTKEIIEEYIRHNIGKKEKLIFYESQLIVVKAAQECILRYAKEANRVGKKDIKKNCEWIAHRPPDNFCQAVQLLWFLHEFAKDDTQGIVISLGRVDQFLYPWYKEDKQKGVITYDKAFRIMKELWKKLAQQDHGFQNVILGGKDHEGKDVCNDLTQICLECTYEMKTEQPALSLRVHDNMPEQIWDKAFKLISTGIGMPSLFNDEVCILAKMNTGATREDAEDFSIVGCVELTIGGKEFSHTEGLRINWLKVLELMLNNGTCLITNRKWPLKNNYSLDNINDFNELFNWYADELLNVAEKACKFIDRVDEVYGLNWPTPFISALMEGCLENGLDVTLGGTLYNNLSVNNAGMANVVNALQAIEDVVFKKKIIRITDISKIIACNFEGYEELRNIILDCPKYGNNIENVDLKLETLINIFCEYIGSLQCNRGGKFQAGFYTVQVHGTMGELTGASMDGRKAKTALANSLSPTQGSDINGPTALLNSLKGLPMSKFGNGMVLDLKFTPDFMKKREHVRAVKDLVKVYFANGGMEIQFNVVDRETLLRAQNEPEKYYDLIVRVSGYSAYFVALSKTLQDEIIKRTEQA